MTTATVPLFPAAPESASAHAAGDWRFLLPIDERSRVLDLTGDDAVARVLGHDAGEVVSVRDADDAERAAAAPRFDVIVLHDAWERAFADRAPSVARLRALRGRAAAGGVLWVAGSTRGPGPRAWERRLARAGFAVRSRFGMLPDARCPERIVPWEAGLAAAAAARWGFPPRGVLGRLLAAGGDAVGAIRRVVPAFGLVAVAGEVPR